MKKAKDQKPDARDITATNVFMMTLIHDMHGRLKKIEKDIAKILDRTESDDM
jgi:hypothetical protein